MSSSFEDNIESFTITFRREIVFYLRQLINDGDRITVTFDGGKENLLTVLLDVDEENGMVIFDWGGSELANRKLIDSDRAYFIATPHGVRNQFVATRVTQTTYRSRPAFATPIPAAYIRLQRREFFRLSLPMTRRPPGRITFGDPPKEYELSVVDIGIGGVAMEGAVPTEALTIGDIIPKAAIDLGKLGKFGVIQTDVQVRYIGQVTRGRTEATRLGLHFVKLHQSHENELQRFITQVQREERAKLG